MSSRSTGAAPSRLTAVLGPTNTGKTHLAVERMLGHASGMIGLPLRLLAREVYDRVVKARGQRAVALITGEEKITPPRPQYYVATVEAMPLAREVEFLAVDEVQLAADPERGHVFTDRLLHARGRQETMLLGSSTIAPLIRRLAPDAEVTGRERFSKLTYEGPRKLTRLPRRSAVVAFSADAVYAIAELIRRQRGGAAVVMGSLSPRTRNAQVDLFQSGEVDFLVATDAIGMGLNMDLGHVAFAGLRKYDGRRSRWLTAQEIGQIAGRAGRYMRDGAFGVTGDCPDIDPDLAEQVETHAFEPLAAVEWRNSRLDFDSLSELQRSLALPPPRSGLKLSEESLDETVLNKLAEDDTIVRRVKDRSNLFLLWDVCQIPDFRKTTLDDHTRFARTVFTHLTERNRKIPDDWIEGQFKVLDRLDGDIDALSARLASVRTLAYVANRSDWLSDPAHWQGRTRALEDRLSDTLHERLVQRFIDRRTSALMRGLHVRDALLAGIAADGAVTVEGHFVGRLTGAHFEAVRGQSALEDRALRAAAERAIGPEVARRLGRLAADPDEAFSLLPNGAVLWRGQATGQLAGGGPFSPRVRLLGELGPQAGRERAQRRLEAFVAAEAGRRLKPLRVLKSAVGEGRIRGLARGLAYRLVEAGGIADRRPIDADVKALSQAERRVLRALGVRFGAFSIFLPALLEEDALAFSAAFARLAAPGWGAAPGRLSALPAPAPPQTALSALGLRSVGALAAPVAMLEQLDEMLRRAPRDDGAAVLSEEAIATLGCSGPEVDQLLQGLGYRRVKRAQGAPGWRRMGKPAPRIARSGSAASPFAALAGIKTGPSAVKRRRRVRRRAAS
ncbi:MAG TPA: helicase-related protein [Caulobacteraceae bacterium]|nr:helicase-related protein [Caulobacteraceae bacterium]